MTCSSASTPEAPAALLLDLDGTLVNSEAANRAAFHAWFAARGWPADEALVNLFTGRRARDVFATLPGPWVGLDPDELHDSVVAMTPYSRPLPIDGAAPLIRAAAGVSRVAVVTSATRDWAEHCLADVLGVRRHVELIVSCEQVSRGKPDPEGYARAATQLGVAPQEAWAVEDAPAGVAAAVAAGVGRVFALTTTFPAAALGAAGAQRVIDCLDEVAALLPQAGR